MKIPNTNTNTNKTPIFKTSNYNDESVKFTWNIFPASRSKAENLIIPVASIYSPLRPNIKSSQYIKHSPHICSACKAILNPYCKVDLTQRVWICAFCLNLNKLKSTKVKELQSDQTTVEYLLQKKDPEPLVFLFVVDTCQDTNSFKCLKRSLLVALSLVPENSIVALITFGKLVSIYDLDYEPCRQICVIDGGSHYESKEIIDHISAYDSFINPRTGCKFLCPIKDADLMLTRIIEDLKPDQPPIIEGRRPLRGTGAALNVALSMLDNLYPNNIARIMLFLAGPATIGPGAVVGLEKKETMRMHGGPKDKNGDTRDELASKFYKNISKRLIEKNYIVDIFAGCLDQVGLYEMKSLVNLTGGVMMMNDSFESVLFQCSLVKLFKNLGQYVFKAEIGIMTSQELKISGLIGHANVSSKKPGPVAKSRISDTVIGKGSTNIWSVSSITDESSFSIFFDIAPVAGGIDNSELQKRAHIQYTTKYLDSNNEYKLRVTTVSPIIIYSSNAIAPLLTSFDNETSAIIIAKFISYEMEINDIGSTKDAVKYLDDILLRFFRRIVKYTNDCNYSLSDLIDKFLPFLKYIYHLRRSQFINTFNNSLDEMTYYRHYLIKENTENSVIMIHPRLTSFEVDKNPEIVPLDILSVKPDKLLLLDTYFSIVIYYGEEISLRKKALPKEEMAMDNEADRNRYESLFDGSKQYAVKLINNRFPLPRYIIAEAGTSQSRFLLAKLNPSVSHYHSDQREAGTLLGYIYEKMKIHDRDHEQMFFTEEESFQLFYENLYKNAMTSIF